MAKLTVNSLAAAQKVLNAVPPQYTVGTGTKNAYAALKKAMSSQGDWTAKINQNLQKITQLGDFDPSKSAYYQSSYHALKNLYRNKAEEGRRDTLAAGSEQTQGYGNSYAATAAAKAYNAALESLAAKVPSLYSAAAQEHENSKSNLAALIGLQQSARQNEIDNAGKLLEIEQALDKEKYLSNQYLDSLKRANANLYLNGYYSG